MRQIILLALVYGKRDFSRDSKQWDPLPIGFPYHSHTSRDSYGCGMGVVWEWGSLLGIPGISLERFFFSFDLLKKVQRSLEVNAHIPWQIEFFRDRILQKIQKHFNLGTTTYPLKKSALLEDEDFTYPVWWDMSKSSSLKCNSRFLRTPHPHPPPPKKNTTKIC